MQKLFNAEKGLTLIELLITIAVLAIVAAIAMPTVTNVIANAEARALEQANDTVDSFLSGFDKGGVFVYAEAETVMSGITIPARTFVGFVDLNANGKIDANEKIAELTLDAKWAPVNSSGDLITIAYPGTSLTLTQLATADLSYPTNSTITEDTVNVIPRVN